MNEEFTQIVDGLKQKKTEVKNRKQSLTDQRITVAGLDAVQRAVVESIKVLTQALLNETLSVNVTNNLQSIETPDALTGADVVRAAIKDLQWTMSQKETDLSPVVDQLTAVLKAVEKLPTEFPEDKEFPTELAVNNLSSVVDEIKTLTDQVKAIELQPNITVTPAEVTVEAPVVNVMIDEQLGRLEEAILQLKPAEVVDNLLDTMLVDQMRAVEEAVRSIKFPVPNNKPVYVDDTGRGVAVQLDAQGRVPTTAEFSGDITIGNVGVKNTDEDLIDPATEQEQVVQSALLTQIRGFNIPPYTKIDLSYTSGNATTVTYKNGASTVATLSLAYDGSNNLTSVELL